MLGLLSIIVNAQVIFNEYIDNGFQIYREEVERLKEIALKEKN